MWHPNQSNAMLFTTKESACGWLKCQNQKVSCIWSCEQWLMVAILQVSKKPGFERPQEDRSEGLGLCELESCDWDLPPLPGRPQGPISLGLSREKQGSSGNEDLPTPVTGPGSQHMLTKWSKESQVESLTQKYYSKQVTLPRNPDRNKLGHVGSQINDLSSVSGSHSGRKEPAPEGWPLTVTHTMAHACLHSHISEVCMYVSGHTYTQ